MNERKVFEILRLANAGPAFSGETYHHGDRYIISRMRVAMGQIPKRLMIEFPEDVPF